ncbi:MAG: Gfo/Idh/MocA family oxidoreductase [Gammaproteobacteria bacterium]|nr:Gfo/Idh/MocA family oxidoreductase [Gammaproteobacteria bacterium]
MNHRETVRLGVIGLGNIAKQHIDNVRSGQVADCEIAALCSRSPSELATEIDVPHFTDYRELIASGHCDAVLVATPTFSHFDIGAAALEAGLHVMMEKPIGMSVKEGEDLLALQPDGQIFALMLNQRTDPLFVTMRDLIEQGTLGEICRTQWTMTNWFRPEIYFQVSDWRATWRGEGGGLLVNQCIHNLDIFQWLCGMPRSVRAFCRFGRYHDIEVEDEATAYFEYDNGASGVFMGSTGEAPGVNRLDIVGDKAALSFDGERLLLIENKPATRQFSRETRDMFGLPQSSVSDITPDRTCNQHAAVLENFTGAILGNETLIAPAVEGINSLALANSMLLSTWESDAIALPLDKIRYQKALERRIANSSLRDKADIEANVDMSASYR